MHITEYFHIHGTEPRDGYIAIPELDRYRPSAAQFIELADLNITLTRPTAFLYVDGFSISQADSGINMPAVKKYSPAIKSGSSFIAHEWAKTFKNREHLKYINVVSSTCAAGIQAIYEAQQLLNKSDVYEVIIIGGERTTDDTMRLFRELGIDIMCGDGFAYMRLEKGPMSIYGVEWKFTMQDNPFYFPREVIDTLRVCHPLDYVKLHGTGTKSNTEAEAGLEEIGNVIIYKDKIGHTQGVSALLETCMVLAEDAIKGNILVTANGFGGYYGAFTLIK
jgi:hypothetical protein